MTRPTSELIAELREHCVGHPHAKIPWPHRPLNEAADRLETILNALAVFQGDAFVPGSATALVEAITGIPSQGEAA
jgi:hypothetical protein